jgi:hypothetical protein
VRAIDAGDTPTAVASLRALIPYGGGSLLTAADPRRVFTKVEAAFERLLAVYARNSGHNYYGWNEQADPRNYRGPTFWTEGDCVYRLALELEREFPHGVHFEVPVANWTFADFDKTIDRRQFIDLVVSDLHEFVEDETSQHRFRTHRHELFLEGKYFHAGCTRTWRGTERRRVPTVKADAERLARHIERGHCLVAAIFVADDDGLFEETVDMSDWPTSVKLLLASQAELGRRGIASAPGA